MLSRTLAVLVALLAATPLRAEEPKAKLLPGFIVHEHYIFAIAFSRDGNLLAVAGGRGEDGFFKTPAVAELAVWDLRTRKKLTDFAGHKGWVGSVAFSPDGKTIASSSSDKSLRLWDVATGKELAVLDDSRRIESLTFSPDGATLTGSVWPTEGFEETNYDPFPGTVLLWDVKERKVRTKLEGHASPAFQVAFSPDGTIIAAVSGVWDTKAGEFQGWYKTGEIKLWDAATGKAKQTLTGHKGGRINAVAFSPDGKTLATGCVVRSGEAFNARRGE
jgi:WD40 repeat protein